MFEGCATTDLEPAGRVPVRPGSDARGQRGDGDGLVLRGIGKRFGRSHVLHDLDLTVSPGSFIAVVGRSGCGKSTLLRLIAGLEAPSDGRVILGKDAAPGSRVRLMFQEPRLLPWARVIANVAVGLGGGMDRRQAQAAAREVLARVGLADRANDWPAVLSGGQKQRVALARALVGRPRLLALDEPLGALDALTRIEMQQRIEDAWLMQGFTAILVTHDVTEAVALADRVLVLEDGRIAEDIAIDLPRPRLHEDPSAAAIAGHILRRLLGRPSPAHCAS